jgi:integrase
MKEGEVVGKKPFTPEQLKRIWRVLEELKNPDLTLLFDLARNTGARLHDLVSWKWTHLTFTQEDGKMEAVLEWKPIKTKNSAGKIMVIPILDERVVSELYRRYQSRATDEDYILPKMLEMYNHNKACAITKLCQKVFRKAGIETKQKIDGNSRANCVFGMHSFRHTLVSELFQKGVDLGTIQHLYTGHGSSYITELYAHADIDRKKVDLSKLARIETGITQPPNWMPEQSEEDKKAFDAIEVMDAPKPVKIMMKAMFQFKSKKELTMIRDWLTKRIETL